MRVKYFTKGTRNTPRLYLGTRVHNKIIITIIVFGVWIARGPFVVFRKRLSEGEKNKIYIRSLIGIASPFVPADNNIPDK